MGRSVTDRLARRNRSQGSGIFAAQPVDMARVAGSEERESRKANGVRQYAVNQYAVRKHAVDQ